MTSTETGFAILSNGSAMYFYQAESKRSTKETAALAVREAARCNGHVQPMTRSHYEMLREMAEDVAAAERRRSAR